MAQAAASAASDGGEDDLSAFRPEEEREKQKSDKNTCCKTFLRFLFSWVGLALLLCAYTILGAWYFYTQEKPLEDHRRTIAHNKKQDIDDAMNYIVDTLEYISFGDDVTGEGKFNNCTVYIQDPFYEPEQGRYADVCLDRTSEAVLNSEFCKCVWIYQERYEQEVSQNLFRLAAYLVTSVEETGYRQDPDTNEFVWQEKWTFMNALLFTMTTLTLIGYGHVSPSTDSLKMQVIAYTIVGIPIMGLFLANIGSMLSNGTIYVYSRICCRWCRVRRLFSEEKRPLTLKDEEVGEEEYMPTDNILVPVTLTLVLMGLYVVGGAFVYVQWEDWSLLDATYFTFVTLTTIGFGDLVPGSSFLQETSDTSLYGKLTFTTLYCLLGLALIAMGIDVMQDHAKAKTKWMHGQEGDEEGMSRYIMVVHHDVRETPHGKTGNKTNFGDDSDDDSDATEEEEVAEVTEVASLNGEEGENEEEEDGEGFGLFD